MRRSSSPSSRRGCAPYPQETSTFLLDPDTGRRTPLQGGDRHIVDVRGGTSLGIHIDDFRAGANSVLLGGAHTLHVTFALPQSYIASAALSPGATRFFATLWSETGCGGEVHALTVSQTVDGADSHEFPQVYAHGWYDDSHLVVSPVCAVATPNDPATVGCPDGIIRAELDVLSMDGSSTAVAHGRYIGVLHPAA